MKPSIVGVKGGFSGWGFGALVAGGFAFYFGQYLTAVLLMFIAGQGLQVRKEYSLKTTPVQNLANFVSVGPRDQKLRDSIDVIISRFETLRDKSQMIPSDVLAILQPEIYKLQMRIETLLNNL